jgi:DNA-binding FadR family transcriptional regulator
LEVLGAVECVGGKGNYIRDQINLESLRYQSVQLEGQISPEEILECREILEPGIAALAARKAEQSDILRLERFVDEYKKLVQSKCDKIVFEKLMQNSRDFHFALAKATHNVALVQLMRFVIRAAKAKIWLNLMEKMLARQDRLKKHLSEHEDILNSVKNRDDEKANKIMQKHIDNIGKNVFD